MKSYSLIFNNIRIGLQALEGIKEVPSDWFHNVRRLGDEEFHSAVELIELNINDRIEPLLLLLRRLGELPFVEFRRPFQVCAHDLMLMIVHFTNFLVVDV